jgi:uncharacterized protein
MQKIALDIDDVLISFNEGFLEFVNEKLGTSYQLSDITTYKYQDVIDISENDVRTLLDEYTSSKNHIETKPVLGARSGLTCLQHKEIILISARPEWKRAITEQWIDLHLPELLNTSTMVLTSQHRPVDGMSRREKGEIAKELAIDIFVEDSLDNALNISEHGIPVLLFDRPWNQAVELPANVTRVYTWEEIVAIVS